MEYHCEKHIGRACVAFKSTASVRNVTRLKKIHFSLVSHVTMWCAVVQSDRLLRYESLVCLNRGERVCVPVRLSLFLVAISFITHRLFIVCVKYVCMLREWAIAFVFVCVCIIFFHHWRIIRMQNNWAIVKGLSLKCCSIYSFYLRMRIHLYLSLSTRIHSDLNYLNRVFGMWLCGCRCRNTTSTSPLWQAGEWEKSPISNDWHFDV